MGDCAEVVGEERLELRGEQVQLVRKQGMGEEKEVLSEMALMGELISAQCQLKCKEIKTRAQLQKWRVWK